MAERRMFAKTIIDSDAFLDMPMTTQALYFHLSMRADDDGFINNPKKIQRMIGATEDDLKLLIAKNFIITFESGVIVIKHWRVHNYIRNDRYKPTVYQEEKALLNLKENEVYTLGIPNGYQMETQVRLGKDSIGKDSIDNISVEEKHKHGVYGRVKLTDKEYNKLIDEYGKEFIDKQIDKVDEYIEMNNNKNKYKNFYLVVRRSINDKWFEKEEKKSKGQIIEDRQNEIKEKFLRGEIN